MCYPKPGPRCSGHAGARRLRLKNELQAFSIFTGNPDSAYNSREELQQAYEEAEREYDLTPAGIKELERRLEQTLHSSHGEPSTHSEEFRLRLEHATRARQARLEALKAAKLPEVETVEHHHDVAYPASFESFLPAAERDELARSSRVKDAVATSPEVVAALIDESEAWVARLTPEETEAVSWYTSNGSSHFNAAILGVKASPSSPVDVRRQKKLLPHLESALTKSERKTPLRVFRGLQHGVPSQKHETEAYEAWLARNFPVGGTYSPKTFSSTTLSWKTAHRFSSSGGSTILEILTKRGGSVSAVSAWGSHETEVILPRDVQYRVVGHTRHTHEVTSKVDGRVIQFPVTVVQLEEI